MLTLFGVRINPLTDAQLLEQCETWLQDDVAHTIFTPNPEFLLQARQDPVFTQVLNQSDLSLADGVGLLFAAAALTDELIPARQTGVDLLEVMASLCARAQKRLVLLGGTPGMAQRAALRMRTRHPTLLVFALDPGMISGSAAGVEIPESVLTELIMLQPDVIAVALGQGKQERVCLDLSKRVPTLKITMGIGGAVDMIAGLLPRAPRAFQSRGLEWMWRLFIQPRRFPRIFRAVVIFPMVVFWGTLKAHRFWKACPRLWRIFIKLF